MSRSLPPAPSALPAASRAGRCQPQAQPQSAQRLRAPRPPVLDARLRAAADWVQPCGICADIGCDHGRLGAALLLENRCQHLLAADVSGKALAKAQKLLSGLGVETRATFAEADGLNALDALPGGRADTVCILGMGGETLAGILQRGQSRLRGAMLVLGAQTELPAVRRALVQIGYRLTRECVAEEGGRLYLLMLAMPAPVGAPPYSERELTLGPCLLRELPAAWEPWLRRRLCLLEGAASAMRGAHAPDMGRLAETQREIADTRLALEALGLKAAGREGDAAL